jgi:hypothetical protein
VVPYFKVDTARIAEAAGGLPAVSSLLGAGVSVDAGAFGGPAAVAAAEEFVSWWGSGSSRLVASLEAVRSAMGGAAGNYGLVEEVASSGLGSGS